MGKINRILPLFTTEFHIVNKSKRFLGYKVTKEVIIYRASAGNYAVIIEVVKSGIFDSRCEKLSGLSTVWTAKFYVEFYITFGACRES